MANSSTSLIERFRRQLRAFVLGPAVVEPYEIAYGHDSGQYKSQEYGEYIATSNGVYACATKRAKLLSSLPLKCYRVRSNGDRQEVTSGQLVALLQKVNPFWTSNRLLQMTELSLCLWGEAFWFLERGENGRMPPREIWWGRPDRVSVIPDPEAYIRGYFYHSLTQADPIPYQPGEVIWIRYPNPIDEYSGLSPLAAARLAADYSSAAMKSNRNFFDQGMQLGGVTMPKAGTQLSPDQARELELSFDRRFRGADKAHRWAVLRFEAQLHQMNITPREAEFTAGLRLALEDIARAYDVPLDLIGGQRTYENVNAAMRAMWSFCVVPEAQFIAQELTEQLLPMFPGQADLAEFDASGIDVLQEAETERWTRDKERIAAGAKTLNEWRKEQGLTTLAWGDVWWAPRTLAPVQDGEPRPVPTLPQPKPMPDEPPEPQRAIQTRAITFGSQEHERLWRRFVRRQESQEKKLGSVVADLFRRQQASILSKLRRAVRKADDLAESPFDLAEWIKRFRVEVRPVLREIVTDAGIQALDDLGLAIAFDVESSQAQRFIERRAQRFAQEVNQTTWDRLRSAIAQAIAGGKGIDELGDEVERVMGDRIRSGGETIARTETIGALNGGTLIAWQQSGVVERKVWLAALDDRTRDTHIRAHEQTVALDEDFTVGAGKGPAPGQLNAAEEDINCRCTMIAEIRE